MGELARRMLLVSVGRCGPEDLPGSREMLVLCAFAWFVITVTINYIVVPNLGFAALGAAAELGLMFGYVRVALTLAGKPERQAQSVAALLGVQTIIECLRAPFIYLAHNQQEPMMIVDLVRSGLMAWWLIATAYIFIQAVGRPAMRGILCFLGYMTAQALCFFVLFNVFEVPIPTPK